MTVTSQSASYTEVSYELNVTDWKLPNKSSGDTLGSQLGSPATWSNPTNCESCDGSYATVTLTSIDGAHLLQGADFQFGLPGAAHILAVEVEVEAYTNDVAQNTTLTPYICEYETSQGNDSDDSGSWTLPTSEELHRFGTSRDEWGGPPTPAEVNDEDWAIGLYVFTTSGSATVYVDCLKVRLWWTQEIGSSQSSISSTSSSSTSSSLTMSTSSSSSSSTSFGIPLP